MSFQDIHGQDRTIEILKEHIKHSRLAGSYLFVGPDGVGKKLVARNLAQSLNCQENNFQPCGQCPSCLKIEHNQHPDVHIIDREEDDTQIKIDYIRKMQREINLRPYEGKTKVFIINDAHNLNAESSNALLKVLEEPPKDSLIILVTAKPNLLFKTIISRCQILKFSGLSRQELEVILKKDYQLHNHLAHFLAYFCEGRIGCALRLKENDILQEKNRVIDYFAAARKSGLDDASLKDRQKIRGYLNILASWFRDMYLIKVGMPHLELINLDRKAELLKSMSKFSFTDLYQMLHFISEALLYLEENVNTKLLVSNLREDISYGARY